MARWGRGSGPLWMDSTRFLCFLFLLSSLSSSFSFLSPSMEDQPQGPIQAEVTWRNETRFLPSRNFPSPQVEETRRSQCVVLHGGHPATPHPLLPQEDHPLPQPQWTTHSSQGERAPTPCPESDPDIQNRHSCLQYETLLSPPNYV